MAEINYFEIVKCEYCRKELSFNRTENTVFYNLEKEITKPACDKCYHSETSKKSFSFCSYECLKKFVFENEL